METPMLRSVKISSVTLNWNGKEELLKCIQSLKKLDIELYEIIVVDNHSEDESVNFLKTNFPDVIVIENEFNLGVSAGYNVGLRRALEKPIDYVLTLDNDLYADKKCVSELARFAEEDKTIGTIGAFIYDAVKTGHLLSAGGIVDFTQNISRQLKDYQPRNGVIDVDYCGTGHRLTRKKVFDEIGLMDESYIGYGFEDIDFGFRVRKAGYRNCTCPTAKVWHKPHSNIGQYTFRKKYLETRNAVHFMKKYANKRDWLKFLFYAILGLPHAFVFQGIIRNNMKGVYGKVKGIYDGILARDQLALEILNQSKKNNEK